MREKGEGREMIEKRRERREGEREERERGEREGEREGEERKKTTLFLGAI
jgi:hypothetical protein